MTNLTKIHNMKTRLKELATKIKRSDYAYNSSLECRHLHMLYGVFRGLSMERIEAKCRTSLCEHQLKKIADSYELEVPHDEIIRYSRSIVI